MMQRKDVAYIEALLHGQCPDWFEMKAQMWAEHRQEDLANMVDSMIGHGDDDSPIIKELNRERGLILQALAKSYDRVLQ